MPDFDAIAQAVAARYAAAQVTPPAGLSNIRLATADLPQKLVVGRSTFRPVVLVFPDEGSLAPSSGYQRQGEIRFKVRFYLVRSVDLARETNALRRWLTVLVDQHKTSMQLGGLVTWCRTVGWRLALLPYAGVTFAGIELDVSVGTIEGWAVTA